MGIKMVKVRAKIEVGGISVVTPYIQSFTVNKQRGQPSNFTASLKVRATEADSFVSDQIRIYAGENTPKLIFTGICKTAKISPCFDDPEFFILSISGNDVLSLLAGKKYTRRCRATKASWVGITGVVREGLRSGKFEYKLGAINVGGSPVIDSGSIVGDISTRPQVGPSNIKHDQTGVPVNVTIVN